MADCEIASSRRSDLRWGHKTLHKSNTCGCSARHGTRTLLPRGLPIFPPPGIVCHLPAPFTFATLLCSCSSSASSLLGQPSHTRESFVFLIHGLLLACHLLCVNLSAMGPLLCVWLAWRRDDGARRLARDSLGALLLGAVLGGSLVALHWSSNPTLLKETAVLLQSRLQFGVWEFLFSLILLVGYYTVWPAVTSARNWRRVLHHCLAVLAATNLLYHFPPLFTIFAQLHSAQLEFDGPIDSHAFRSLLLSAEVATPTLHHWLASVATTCVYVQLQCVGCCRPRTATAEKERLVVVLARVTLLVTLLQIPVGLWFLTVLPAGQQTLLFGENWYCAIWFVVGLLGTLGLIHRLLTVAWGEVSRTHVIRTAWWLLLVTVSMSMTLVGVRG